MEEKKNKLIHLLFQIGFFENLAFEAKVDSEKSVMIKKSIHARKTLVRRAKTMRYQANRSRHTKGNVIFDFIRFFKWWNYYILAFAIIEILIIYDNYQCAIVKKRYFRMVKLDRFQSPYLTFLYKTRCAVHCDWILINNY